MKTIVASTGPEKPTEEAEKKSLKTARDGRDEMNLAEFPSAILTTRSNDGVKTLRFHDNHGVLTVTASDALGLPTAIDTDVLVGLIELTKKKNNFATAKVHFTRYELIQLIGWANVGSSYDRLKESLDRWAGVLLIYDGCWWDNHLKKYTSRTVHIIEDITIIEGRSKSEQDGRQQNLPLSSFTWSTHFMESFKANNLKSLDTKFYFSLDFPTSKQLFRFLDKRFANGHPEWTFNLKDLAYEHIGLSRNYTPAKIKEKLGKAIEELETKVIEVKVPGRDKAEERKFLKPLDREERYFKTGDTWKIRLIDGRTHPVTLAHPPEPKEAPSPLVEALISRGITEKAAVELVRRNPDAIAAKIEVFDWLKERKDKRLEKSPEGYLVASITGDYRAPKGFVSAAQREEQAKARRLAQEQEAEERRHKHETARRERELADKIKAYRQAQTPERIVALEGEAIAQASEEVRQGLDDPYMKPFRRTQISLLTDALIGRMIEMELEIG